MRQYTKTVLALAVVGLLAGCSSTGGTRGVGAVSADQVSGVTRDGNFGGLNLSDNTIGMGPSSLTASQAAAVAQLPRKVYFGFDKFDLNGDAITIANANVQFMLNNPSIPVLIGGNTDPRGSQEYNFHLGERRANALKDYLLAQGIPATQLCTVSFGELKPAISPAALNGDSERAYALDRRDEIIYGQTCSGK